MTKKELIEELRDVSDNAEINIYINKMGGSYVGEISHVVETDETYIDNVLVDNFGDVYLECSTRID